MTKHANFLYINKNDGVYTISLTPELQDDIGTVGYVEFTTSDILEKDDAIVNIEAAKTVLEITSPLAGKIIEKNEAAEDQPNLLNSENVEENWLVRLTDVNEDDYNALEEA